MPNILSSMIKGYYRRRGYDVAFQRQKLIHGQLPHHIVSPKATYSPWRADDQFKALHEQIKGHTRVDIFRCYELWQLAAEARKLQGDFLEVGVWRGGTGAIVAKMAQVHSPSAKVFLCDTFSGVVKAGAHDNSYRGGEHADTSLEIVQSLVQSLGLSNVELLQGIFPDDTGRAVADRTFKFCHIDVDVYEGAKIITEWIWERLVVGGVIVYDDFGFSGTQGVTEFVEGERAKDDRLVIHNLNGHGIIVKLR